MNKIENVLYFNDNTMKISLGIKLLINSMLNFTLPEFDY